jgi:hypothetical protein
VKCCVGLGSDPQAKAQPNICTRADNGCIHGRSLPFGGVVMVTHALWSCRVKVRSAPGVDG